MTKFTKKSVYLAASMMGLSLVSTVAEAGTWKCYATAADGHGYTFTHTGANTHGVLGPIGDGSYGTVNSCEQATVAIRKIEPLNRFGGENLTLRDEGLSLNDEEFSLNE